MFEIEQQGAVFVFRAREPLGGERLDDEARHDLEAALVGGQPLGVFDLEQTALIDSRGLNWLLDAQDVFESRGGSLKLAAANALCRDILRCTEVGERFELHNNVRAAVGSFAR